MLQVSNITNGYSPSQRQDQTVCVLECGKTCAEVIGDRWLLVMIIQAIVICVTRWLLKVSWMRD